MKLKELLKDNEKLVAEFGAEPLSRLKDVPDFYTFKKELYQPAKYKTTN